MEAVLATRDINSYVLRKEIRQPTNTKSQRKKEVIAAIQPPEEKKSTVAQNGCETLFAN